MTLWWYSIINIEVIRSVFTLRICPNQKKSPKKLLMISIVFMYITPDMAMVWTSILMLHKVKMETKLSLFTHPGTFLGSLSYFRNIAMLTSGQFHSSVGKLYQAILTMRHHSKPRQLENKMRIARMLFIIFILNSSSLNLQYSDYPQSWSWQNIRDIIIVILNNVSK